MALWSSASLSADYFLSETAVCSKSIILNRVGTEKRLSRDSPQVRKPSLRASAETHAEVSCRWDSALVLLYSCHGMKCALHDFLVWSVRVLYSLVLSLTCPGVPLMWLHTPPLTVLVIVSIPVLYLSLSLRVWSWPSVHVSSVSLPNLQCFDSLDHKSDLSLPDDLVPWSLLTDLPFTDLFLSH